VEGSLLTWADLATFAGATAATWLIANVIAYVTGYKARWVGLAVAIVIQALVWFFTTDQSANAAVLALVNAFVIFVGGSGTAAIAGAATRQPGTMGNERRFLAPWW
jgi:hypothetical protein